MLVAVTCVVSVVGAVDEVILTVSTLSELDWFRLAELTLGSGDCSGVPSDSGDWLPRKSLNKDSYQIVSILVCK